MKNKRQGSALVMVLISALVIGMITASILTLANGQRRVNIRKELQLQANNAAEACVDYAYSYLINEINANTLAHAPSVPTSGAKSFTIPANSLSLIADDFPAPAGFTGPTSRVKVSSSEVKVIAPEKDGKRFLVDGKDPANANDPNVNQWVQEKTVPLISKVTVQQGSETATAYVHRGVSVREVYLFQHAIFFSGQLQLHRGFRPLGDVHSNGPLLINAHDEDLAKYTGFISTASKFYRGSTIDSTGTGGDAYGYTRVNSTGELDMASGVVKPVATGEGKITIFTGTTGGVDQYASLTKTFDSRMSGWKDKAIETFKGHLKDISHQAPQLVPIGSSGYRLDAPGTTDVNEFNNGPYSLIEPLLPKGHANRKNAVANGMNLEAQATLIFRVEVRRDLLTTEDPHKSTADGVIRLYDRTNPTGEHEKTVSLNGTNGIKEKILTPSGTAASGKLVYTLDDLKKASNITDALVVKAYINTGDANGLVLTPVVLPPKVAGAANSTISAIRSLAPGAGVYHPAAGMSGAGFFEPYRGPIKVTPGTPYHSYTADTSIDIASGLHDARLGRGVDLFTIDLKELKRIMDDDKATLGGGDNLAFREALDGVKWKGVVYVEFPTSLDKINYDPAKLAVGADTDPSTPNYHEGDPQRNIVGPYDSYAFLHGSAELKHPDRWADTDNLARKDRTDGIVPIAPEFRRYPSSFDNIDIANRYYAIPAVQLINATTLPSRSPGFTIATNGPIYLVGNYNSDGDYATGSNILKTGADDYAEGEKDEVSSAIFCDTFTSLSTSWPTNRAKSFFGAGGDASKRPVARVGTKRTEIGACIATGEYPIFEFFFHALEDYNEFNSGSPVVNPIIVKGSVVGMFHSEIQHIKQAYGREKEKDIQVYWNAHGAHAFTSVRYHDWLMLGTFPPGTPRAQVTYQVGYRLLRPGDADDKALLQQAGFL